MICSLSTHEQSNLSSIVIENNNLFVVSGCDYKKKSDILPIQLFIADFYAIFIWLLTIKMLSV